MRERIRELTSRLRYLLLGGALVVAGTSVAFTEIRGRANDSDRPDVHLSVDNTPVSREKGMTTSFGPVVRQVAPSVVKVFTTSTIKNAALTGEEFFNDPFFRRFFGEPNRGESPRGFSLPKQHGLGSGVIVSEDGYILTNNHVVESADEIRVAVASDGSEYPAKVVGSDPRTDIAVLKIEAKDQMAFATLGDSDQIEIGDVVLAVGNPFGIGQTVTMGIISATGRGSLGLEYEDFIQTDAAINPGNSGGALVDAEGRVIGINTAILSRSGGNNGIGFAVPINLARSVMEGLIEHGRVIRGFLGVTIQDLTPALAKGFGVDEPRGALVADVNKDGPAAQAGLKSGDVIVAFNGKPVKDSRHLKLQVAQSSPSSTGTVTVLREGKQTELKVKLGESEGTGLAVQDRTDESRPGDALSGVVVGDVDSRARQQLGLPRNLKGALVTQVRPDSPAYEAGLREGDVLLEVNRTPVENAADAIALSEKIEKDRILLRVWSRGGSRYLVVDESRLG